MNKQIDLGEGYYITYKELPNDLGGCHTVNITIRRYDDEWHRYRINDIHGSFDDFPGVEGGDWESKMTLNLVPSVFFAFYMSSFKDGKCTIKWEVQPDGRYFEEDGFGAGDFDAVYLYSVIDGTGRFLVPFSDKKPDNTDDNDMELL